MLKHKKNEIHSKPSKNVSKAISMMKGIDSGVIDRLTEKETAELKQNLTKLTECVNKYADVLQLQPVQTHNIIPKENADIIFTQAKTTYLINIEKLISPVSVSNRIIKSLIEKIQIVAEEECIVFFIDKTGNKISNECIIIAGTNNIDFELKSSVSSTNKCYLVVKHPETPNNEVSQIIPFDVKMMFTSKFDF
jgi:hypothetical protein